MSKLKIVNNATVLDGLFLFAVSENHRYYTVYELFHYFIYPLMHDKVRVWYDENNKPIGLVTWCFLSTERAAAFLNDDCLLEEKDYMADEGDEFWGIELIAPFGHARKIMTDLKTQYRKKYGKQRPIYWRRMHQPYHRRKGRF